MPVIELIDVSKNFGGIKAADHLDLEVMNGEYLCLLGPTGAGKTTTLRIVAGLMAPDSGRIMFDGKDITELEPEDRKAALLSQTYALFPNLTVQDNILFGPNIRNVSEEEKEQILVSMLDLVRLSGRSDAFPMELSGGMMQRTALARALASGAELLLLDEPLRALDARLRIMLRSELRSLAKGLGMTTIHVTHDQDEALVMADRVAVIRHGRIIQIGTPKEVWDNPVCPFVANFVGQSNFFIGKVQESGENRTVLRMNDGTLVIGKGSALPVGEEAVLGVKIGNTEIYRTKPGLFKAKVERVLFEGRNLHIDMITPTGDRISSKVPSWKKGKLTTGDEVSVTWEQSKATVFPIPPGGLEEELKVE